MRLIGNLRPWVATLGLAAVCAGVHAQQVSCDRACLSSHADTLLDSMVSHTIAKLPLNAEYAATADGQPAGLPMMTLWRTVTSVKNKYYVVDPTSSQIFLIATLSEGPNDALLFGRLKVMDNKLSEIELYTDRSRANGGFQFDAAGSANFPVAWTTTLEPKQKSSRAELLKSGRSIFDNTIDGPTPAAGCVLMENGKIVGEDPEVLKSISATPLDKSKQSFNPDGTVQIPCGVPPGRPIDKKARTDLVDEERGIVLSFAVVSGMVEPYLATNPAVSAFVPFAMLSPYTDMLKKQQDSGKFKIPAMRPMAAALTVAELYRIYDGKLQGMMMLQNMAPTGAASPWVSQSQ
jgi:hypothetical protein